MADGVSGAAVDTGLNLADLVDAPMLQSMMDDFYDLTHIPMALIDLHGVVVVGAGWQDVCTRFHRVNPETCAYCIESDTVLTAGIPAGEARLYQCKNGMWDAATPLQVGGEHVGNLFTGQFFFDDEPVDREFFRAQAQRYGFDEQDFLAAVEAVPRLGRTVVDTGLRFLTKLSTMISQLSYSNMQRADAESELQTALANQTRLTEDLATERGVLQAIMENTDTHLAYLDPNFDFVAVNSAYARGSGHTEAELIGHNHFELFPSEENEAIFEHARETGEPAQFRAKPFEFADQPWRGVTYWDWCLTAVKDRDGRLQGFAFSLQDVTRVVRQRTFSDAINRLNDVIHSDLDFDSILAQFVPELAAATGCEVVAVALRSPDGSWRFGEVFGLPDDLKSRVFGDEHLVGATEALESGHPIVVVGGGASRPAPGLAGDLGIRSLLVAPLTVGGRRLGAISYGYVTGPGEFDENAIDFAGKIAASLSLALNNSRLFHEEMHSARLSGALAKVNEILLSAIRLEDVLARLVGEASEVAGADKSLVIEVRDGAFTVTHVRNLRDDIVGRAHDASFFPGFALAASLGQPLLIEDNWTDPRTNKEFVVPNGLRAFQLLPLTTQGVVTHVLALAYDEPQSFDEGDRRSAQRMTAAMSVALNNARLFEAEQAGRRREAALRDIAQASSASLQPVELASRLAERLALLFEAEQVQIRLVNESGTVLEPAGTVDSEGLLQGLGDMRVEAETETAECFRSGEPRIGEMVGPGPAEERSPDTAGAGTCAILPVLVAGRPIGTFYIAWAEPRRFTSDDVSFLQAVTAQFSVGLQNARLYETERHIADRLQEALLALPEEVRGVEFAHTYHSATETARVGGDFYDLFELDQDRLGVVIGDVAGKGLDAAVLTSMVKHTIRAHAAEKGKTPDRILGLTNEVIFRATSAEAFVTVFFGILDRRTGRIVYSNAGHATAAEVRSDGSVARLPTTGPLLGAFSEVAFGQAEACLDTGDLLFLHTDGLTEARRDRELYGEERLFEFLASTSGADPRALVDAVIADVLAFSGNSLRDDLAILSVKR